MCILWCGVPGSLVVSVLDCGPTVRRYEADGPGKTNYLDFPPVDQDWVLSSLYFLGSTY